MPPSTTEFPVHDDYGRQIGWTSRDGSVWHAIALDGAELGSHDDRSDADAAIRLDWTLGRPRNPRTRERFRPVRGGVDAGLSPLYLGR